jgi:hypothetical protein
MVPNNDLMNAITISFKFLNDFEFINLYLYLIGIFLTDIELWILPTLIIILNFIFNIIFILDTFYFDAWLLYSHLFYSTANQANQFLIELFSTLIASSA